MLSEEVIDKVIERLVNRIEQVNEYVLREIGGHIKRVRNVIPSRAYQLGQLIKYGGDYDKIVKKLSEITNLNVKEIYEIFDEVAKNDYYFAKQFYRYRNKQYIPYEHNLELQNQVKAIARLTANEYVNLSNTFGFAMRENGKLVYTDLSKSYQDAIDKAVISVSQGTTTFDEQMRETIRELGESGIRTIDYASGRSKRLDSAVRMNLKEGLRTLHNETQKMFGEQFGSDGVEVTVHAYPAPDHEDVQGRQFSNEEFDKFQNHIDAVDYKGNLYTADFNGHDRRAISTLNCYHTTMSIVLGISKPIYTDKQLQDIKDKNEKGFEFEGKHYTLYEGSQLQRKIELEVRKQKDVLEIAKASGNTELVNDANTKIRQLKNKYTELNSASGIRPKWERMRIDYGNAKVNIDNVPYEDITDKMLKEATPNSHEVLDRAFYEYEGKKYKIKKNSKDVVLDYSDEEKATALWIEKNFGGEIYMNPRINNPKGISTADYLWNDELWDLKGMKRATSLTRAFDNAIKNCEKQSNNFIVDLTDCKIDDNTFIKQVETSFIPNSKLYRDWLNKVIIKRDDKLIKVIAKK